MEKEKLTMFCIQCGAEMVKVNEWENGTIEFLCEECHYDDFIFSEAC